MAKAPIQNLLPPTSAPENKGNMEKLSIEKRNELLEGIVILFGERKFPSGGYVFDAITKLPPGYTGERVSAHVLATRLQTEGSVFVVFDTNPYSVVSTSKWSRKVGLEDVLGIRAAPEEISSIYSEFECDFYVLNESGFLLAVATHEDECGEDGRMIWAVSKLPM